MTQPNVDDTRTFDTNKFEMIHQVGGIRTATFDYPDAGGSAGCRVAMVDTGGGLRFTVALDRGGDLVEATHDGASLAYLTPNGYKPPSHAYNRGLDWLYGWPGGLVTTCGPQTIGGPHGEGAQARPLHGHFSNCPAALTAVHNPDPRRGDLDMHLDLVVRDARMFGPVVEVRRRIACTLGEPVIRIHDEVTNLANTRVEHNWLYHVNLGYPLLDEGAKLVYAGPAWLRPRPARDLGDLTVEDLNGLKCIGGPNPEHAGIGELCVLLQDPADRDGTVHVGLVNAKRGLVFEMSYPKAQLPRMVNWQHLGPGGSYVTALEPYRGSLIGKENEGHPLAEQWLEPGQSQRYDLTLKVHRDAQSLLAHDGDVTPTPSSAR